jgi:hypothetical protein
MWNSPYTQYIDYKFPELALQLLTKATEVASLRKASSCTSPEESPDYIVFPKQVSETLIFRFEV